MTETRNNGRDEALDRSALNLLGGAPARADVSSRRLTQMRDRVMRRVDEETATVSLFATIRSDQGAWIEIAPLAEKKVLNVDIDTGIESYLLRLQPGATLAPHRHEESELCVVLEGEVSFDEIRLRVGDYHMARKGSAHGTAHTVHGALLFLQSGVASAQPVV